MTTPDRAPSNEPATPLDRLASARIPLYIVALILAAIAVAAAILGGPGWNY